MTGIVFLVITAVYLAVDKTGHSRLDGRGHRMAYVILSMLPFIPVFVSLAGSFDPALITEIRSFGDLEVSPSAGVPLIGMLIGLVNAVLCVVGFAGTSGESDDALSGDLFSMGAVLSCFALTALTISAFVFAAAAVSFAGSVIYRMVAVTAAAIVLALLTFGIGLLVMAFAAIYYIPFAGIDALAVCAPLFELSGAAMMIFFVFHMFAACSGIIAVLRLRNDKIYTAGRAAVMIILCCLPVVDIPVLMCLASERKKSSYSMI
ncbi:MAG: hypothetical protein J6I96_03190 [Oscillospiraceae bacterium]|nr:hypothetical protein [Oscillospiraceae bacterium]